jgi:hypothetical protein
MKINIYENSHFGTGLFIIELILTMIFINVMLVNVLKINIHPAIRLVGFIVLAIILFVVFNLSKIGFIIISIFYSVIWTLILGEITNNQTHGDKIWMIVIGGITFLISMGLHFGSRIDTGADYTATSYDDNM